MLQSMYVHTHDSQQPVAADQTRLALNRLHILLSSTALALFCTP